MTISIALFVVVVLVALMVGSCVGVFILAMCQISARSDEAGEKMKSGFSEREDQ